MVLLILIEQGFTNLYVLQSAEMAATLLLNCKVKIDGKGVDYTEVANNMNSRILSIDFSKDNRFMEIIGTQMAS